MIPVWAGMPRVPATYAQGFSRCLRKTLFRRRSSIDLRAPHHVTACEAWTLKEISVPQHLNDGCKSRPADAATVGGSDPKRSKASLSQREGTMSELAAPPTASTRNHCAVRV
jgi:hypothetical protein